MSRPSIILYESPIEDPNLAYPLERMDAAEQWTQTKRFQGGDWEASFFIPLKKNSDGTSNEADLRNFFLGNLFYQIECRAEGARAWRGVVWDMQLVLNGSKEVRSLDDVWNKVIVVHLDDNVFTKSAAAEDGRSQGRYGVREIRIPQAQFGAADAASEAKTYLAYSAQPITQTVRTGTTEAPGLYVDCVGGCYLLNALWFSTGDGSTTANGIGEWIQETIQNSTDNEFVGEGRISLANPYDVDKTAGEDWNIELRVWEAIQVLTQIGDNAGGVYRAWVDSNFEFNYQEVDNEPTIYYHGPERGYSDASGGRNFWTMQPGVLRNMRASDTTQAGEGFLAQHNDSWVLEVTMSEGKSTPDFKFDDFDPDALGREVDRIVEQLENTRNDAE